MNKLVYLLGVDGELSTDLDKRLGLAGYQLRYFFDFDELEVVCGSDQPVAIIIDGIELPEGLLKQLNTVPKTCPPLILISDENTIECRLAVARAGVRNYFSKPLNINKLVQTLDSLTLQLESNPYRVLIIDDDETSAIYYSAVLNNAGMQSQSLSNPLESLTLLEQFKPDIIIMDVYMPECTGLELVQVIRQDDNWALTPIVFLSSDSDVSMHLQGIDIGGDDFLVKPVDAGQLVSVVRARAKRARWTNKLSNDMQMVLRENQYYLITMDQHDIISMADVYGCITAVNDRFCAVSGYSREELLGSDHRILKSGFHTKEFYDEMWKTISRGEIWSGTVCNRRKNGSEYWVESTIVPFLDSEGKPYKYVSARTDITDMKVSKERLERSQTYANIGTWDWDIRNDEVYWSDRVKELYGYSTDIKQVSFDDFIKVVHADDVAAVNNAITACLEQGVKYDIEHRIIWPDGRVRWMLERGDVIRSEEGELLHMLGLVQDVTERKHAELALQESEEKYRLLFELSEDPMWLIVKDRFVMANKAAAHILDYDSAQALINTHPSELSPKYQPDEQLSFDKANELLSIAYREGYHRFEWAHKKKNGEVFPVDVSLTRVPYEGGEALYCVWRDISENKRVEIRRKGNSRILELIAKANPEGKVLEAVISHAEAMLSGAICSILLLDASGKHLYKCIAPGLPDFYNQAIEGIEIGMGVGSCGEAAYSGERVIACDVMTHPNWVNFRELMTEAGLRACWSEPFFSSSGAVLGTFAIYYPMPRKPESTELNIMRELAQFVAIAVEQQRSQQALVSAKEEAENANRAKSQFLSSMSHELRTPLNAIMGFSQLMKLETDSLNELQLESVNDIYNAGSHLLNLINEVLDLAKIEAGHVELSIKTIKLGEVFAESLQLVLPLAEKKGIEIDLKKLGAEVSYEQFFNANISVRADHTRLKQVMINLISNAIKYNIENGNITISIDAAENDMTRISVIDTGHGLSQKQQSQLFKAFNRLGADKTEIEGTGIGLVITKNIVELMGGNIGVQSETGVGSTFWIELPSDNLSLDAEVGADVQQANAEEISPLREKAYRVLYIEDNPANLRLVNKVLGRLDNISMWSAHEPLLGLELALEHKPDLILLDINLPGMSGFQVLEKLRQQLETKHTPVIAVSANATESDIEKGFAAGFDDYITKPIDVELLLKTVSDVLFK